MLTSQRKALIAQRLTRDGEIVAKTLATELDLSEDTIRRDLREMAAEGLLKRVHGGALPLAPPLPDFAAVKPQIDQYLERKAQQDLVLAMREKAKVERLDKPAADAAKPAEPKKN